MPTWSTGRAATSGKHWTPVKPNSSTSPRKSTPPGRAGARFAASGRRIQRMSRVIRGSGAWFTERVSREGVSMKYMGPIVAVFLLAICAPAWAVVLPEEVAKKLEQRIDAFVDAPGHERLDVNAMLDGDWYARFEGAGEFALPPDADVDPVKIGRAHV